MAPKAAGIPGWLITLDKGMLAGADEPITLDLEKTTSYFAQEDISPSRDLTGMLTESAFEGRLEGLLRVDQLAPPIQGIYAFLEGCDIFRKRVGRAGLEFLDELAGESLVELEEEFVFVAQCSGILANGDPKTKPGGWPVRDNRVDRIPPES